MLARKKFKLIFIVILPVMAIVMLIKIFQSSELQPFKYDQYIFDAEFQEGWKPRLPESVKIPEEDYYNTNSQSFIDALEKMGLEPAEWHPFKSPYIYSPHLFNDSHHTVFKPPGVRKTKIISLFEPTGLNSFMEEGTRYNRDFKRCPYSECEVDVFGKKISQADMVIHVCDRGLPPPPRPPGQLWVIGCWESAPLWHYAPDYKYWKDAFNYTMSYRLDTDINTQFVRLGWRHSSQLLKEEEYVAIAKNKSKTATWWATNCKEDRLRFVQEMQKYIDIDIIGKCEGALKICPKSNGRECMIRLTTTYKFYLSFENYFCKDYVTEKIQKLFGRHHVVPVAKGGLDYDANFPPNVLVNGNKFKTAKDLALYLKDLGNDIPRYAKMLQEKDKLATLPHSNVDWCGICEMMHTNLPNKIYHDIKSWSHTNSCKRSEYTIA